MWSFFKKRCCLLGVSEVDYSLYPSRKLQEQWLRAYLEAYKEYKGFGTDVTEKEVEVLYVQVNQFALVSSRYLVFRLCMQVIKFCGNEDVTLKVG